MSTKKWFWLVTSLAIITSVGLWRAVAQQSDNSSQSDVTYLRYAPPMKPAEAPERVKEAVQYATHVAGEAQLNIVNSTQVRILQESPSLTMPLLVPYALHPNDTVREVVLGVAVFCLRDKSVVGEPVSPELRDLAIRLLVQISSSKTHSTAPLALQELYDHIYNNSSPAIVKQYQKAGLKAALMNHLSQKGYPNEYAVSMLSLFRPDANVFHFLERLAKRTNYPTILSIALSQWGEGNAQEAVVYVFKNGEPATMARGISSSVRFVDNPHTLQVFLDLLDDKRIAFETINMESDDPDKPFRLYVRDYAFAALQFKIGIQTDPSRPTNVSDEQIAAAKPKFQAFINSLPVPRPPQD